MRTTGATISRETTLPAGAWLLQPAGRPPEIGAADDADALLPLIVDRPGVGRTAIVAGPAPDGYAIIRPGTIDDVSFQSEGPITVRTEHGAGEPRLEIVDAEDGLLATFDDMLPPA